MGWGVGVTRQHGEDLHRAGPAERTELIVAPDLGGIEVLRARFIQHSFEPHFHDTFLIGMTLAEVNAALGPDSDPEAIGGPDPESCDQFRPGRAPEGMLAMIEEGRLTRISLIDDSKVKTDRDLGIGIPASVVRATYGSALQTTPHKYQEAPAEYLTIWAKGGGPIDRAVPPHSRGIQYVVDSTGKVETIHAGVPSILYVEGCA